MLKQVQAYIADIKIEHSIFALPFAFSAIVFSQFHWPSLLDLLALLVCMVSARSFAMGVNRLVDAPIDVKNPRTRDRKIPSGKLNKSAALFINLFFAGLFVVAAFCLNSLAGFLSPAVLLIFVGYPFLKRHSVLCHFYLGFCLGLAPLAVEIALNGSISWPIVLIGLSVLCWTAGFDMIYALLDQKFDQENGLYSIPARYGREFSLRLSSLCFCMMLGMLAVAGSLNNVGNFYYFGLLAMGFLLLRIQLAARQEKINQAFFSINMWVPVTFGLAVLIDRF